MKGAYILILYLKKKCKIRIGNLGLKKFRYGYYAYIGSAFGKTITLENRIRRHLKLTIVKRGPQWWHVDYLLLNKNVLFIEFLELESNRKVECILANAVMNIAEDFIPNFGSTDCNYCPSHLYYFHRNPSDSLRELIDDMLEKSKI